jgi:hypothetical protein
MNQSLLASAASLLLILTMSIAPASAGQEYHVSPSGDDANDGSPAAMLQSISEAARRARAGDVVTVHEGIYRERVNPPRGGTGEADRIVYQAVPGEVVVVKGSEPLAGGWSHVGEDTWSVTVPNSFFGDFNPFNHIIVGDWFFRQGRDHHAGAVYLDGHWLTESATKDEVLQAAGANPLWFAEVEGGGYLMNVGWFQPMAGTQAGARVAADSFARDLDVITEPFSEGGDCIGHIEDLDWTRYEQVDFGTDADSIAIRAASPTGGGKIELRLDAPDGPLLGTCPVSDTGGWQSWATHTASITPTSGVHTLCLVFKSPQSETASTTIWAQFPDGDPNGADVEVNARQSVFYPEAPGINYITVRGFTMENAATPWAPPSAEQIGVIGTHWSKGWIIEENTIRYSTCSGVTLGKYGDRWDNRAGNYATHLESINRALAAGWNKDTVGSHLVRNNKISHCEQSGIVGSMGGAFSTITGNQIHDIHVRRLFSGFEQAGIKLHGAIDTVLSNNHIYRNDRGIWLDWMAQGARVSSNLLHDNRIEDLFLEVNHGPALIDHNIFLSITSLTDRSQGGAYAHNLFTGRIAFNPDNVRSTPYHQAHATAVAGFSTIPGGDERFYNNILTGAASLAGYNSTVRPVWMAGNVFLDGATASSQESAPLVDAGFDPAVRLYSTGDGTYLEMEIDGSWATAQTRSLVTTALLGNAAVPDTTFEQSDGSPYRLDTDYLAAARNETNPFPGPFEAPLGGLMTWKVSEAVSSAALPDPGAWQTYLFEDFGDNSPEPDMALGAADYGTPTTDFAGAFTITSGAGSRIYLATKSTDFSAVDFVFEAEVTVPDTTEPGSIAFFGMGNPSPDPGYYGEPLSAPNALMAVRNDSASLQKRDNGPSRVKEVTGLSIPGGTHLLRMRWDKDTQQATFEFDQSNNGSIDGTFTVDGSDNGFDATNAQLLLGGGNGLSFDNILVRIPAPPTLEIELLGDQIALTWNSRAGKTYDILRSTTLGTDPLTWAPWRQDIEATPPENSETFSFTTDSAKFFFVVVEK